MAVSLDSYSLLFAWPAIVYLFIIIYITRVLFNTAFDLLFFSLLEISTDGFALLWQLVENRGESLHCVLL